MISATVLAILFVPLFFVAVKKLFKQELIVTGQHEQAPTSAPEQAKCCCENFLSRFSRPLFLPGAIWTRRSEEHTSEIKSLMRISYAVFCLKNKNKTTNPP